APITVQNVVTYNVVIGVDNSDLRLRPGMTANVSIIVASRENVLRVPNPALRFKPTLLVKGDDKAGSSQVLAADKRDGGRKGSLAAPASRDGADEPARLPGPRENLSLGRDGRPRLAGGVADDRHRRVCGRHGGLGFRQIHLDEHPRVPRRPDGRHLYLGGDRRLYVGGKSPCRDPQQHDRLGISG